MKMLKCINSRNGEKRMEAQAEVVRVRERMEDGGENAFRPLSKPCAF